MQNFNDFFASSLSNHWNSLNNQLNKQQIGWRNQTLWRCRDTIISWWRHQMETFSALLALCAGNSPVTGEFPSQRSVTWSFDIFFDLHLNKRLSKQLWGWWFEMTSCPLWRHCNVESYILFQCYVIGCCWVYLQSNHYQQLMSVKYL